MGWRAVQFIGTGEPIAIAIGIALIVLPIIAAWALWRELAFGIRSQALVKRLEAEGGLDLGLPLKPSGRPERAAADAAFDGFRAEAEAAPTRGGHGCGSGSPTTRRATVGAPVRPCDAPSSSIARSAEASSGCGVAAARARGCAPGRPRS